MCLPELRSVRHAHEEKPAALQTCFAAAIRAKADVIVTFNLKDFPAEQLARYRITAQHPDIFIANLFARESAKVCEAAAAQRRSLRNPPKTREEFLDILSKQKLPQTVALLRTQCTQL